MTPESEPAPEPASGSADQRRPAPAPKREDYFTRRQNRIRDEIERNRRGEYRVPTWVLAAALLLLVAGWLVLVLIN